MYPPAAPGQPLAGPGSGTGGYLPLAPGCP